MAPRLTSTKGAGEGLSLITSALLIGRSGMRSILHARLASNQKPASGSVGSKWHGGARKRSTKSHEKTPNKGYETSFVPLGVSSWIETSVWPSGVVPGNGAVLCAWQWNVWGR